MYNCLINKQYLLRNSIELKTWNTFSLFLIAYTIHCNTNNVPYRHLARTTIDVFMYIKHFHYTSSAQLMCVACVLLQANSQTIRIPSIVSFHFSFVLQFCYVFCFLFFNFKMVKWKENIYVFSLSTRMILYSHLNINKCIFV